MNINDIYEFKKIQEQCSNIFLLDENLCLGNSYDVINHNIISLSSNINNLQSMIDYFNSYYTYFTQNSSNYLEINKNINDGYDNYNNLYSYVYNLSSQWTRPIGIYYNKLLSVSDWNLNKLGLGQDYPRNKLLIWLNQNYPTNKFSKNQTIVLYVTLFQSTPFRFDAGFTKSFYEKCYVAPRSVRLNCDVNTCRLSSGSSCNYTSSSGVRSCGDPINGCNKSASGGYSGPVTCPTTGQKTLTVSHTKTNYDKHTSTSIGIRYKVNSTNTSWEYINQI
jgi:hypothetical protein